MGVWIETKRQSYPMGDHQVTPFVGVWIETGNMLEHLNPIKVTPFVGVWIETIGAPPGG